MGLNRTLLCARYDSGYCGNLSFGAVIARFYQVFPWKCCFHQIEYPSLEKGLINFPYNILESLNESLYISSIQYDGILVAVIPKLLFRISLTSYFPIYDTIPTTLGSTLQYKRQSGKTDSGTAYVSIRDCPR